MRRLLQTMKRTLAGLLFLSPLALAAGQSVAPRIEITPRTANLDTLIQGQVKSARFEVRNAGKRPLRIDRTSTDCGCAVATIARYDLAPDSSAVIDVGFNSAQFRGLRESRLLVFSSDPVRPVDTLVLRAYVRTELDCTPRNLFFPNVPHGIELARPILLFNTATTPIKVISMKPQEDYVAVGWRRPRVLNPGDTIPVDIRVNPPDSLRRFSTAVVVQVDREQSQPFSIRVYGFYEE